MMVHPPEAKLGQRPPWQLILTRVDKIGFKEISKKN